MDFYQFVSEPFSTHPDPGIIFVSTTHQQAWYYLLSSIDSQEPYLVLTGEYGMGKTLLCLRLIQVLSKRGTPAVAYIATPNEGYDGILRRIAANLGIFEIPEEVSSLQSMIYDHFRTQVENVRLYLIIDDAQELDSATLARLKQLSIFNHNGFFPVSIIFAAHPSFLEELKTPALISLNQRIKRRYHLSRFSLEDTKHYILFRLQKSGATGIPEFTDESIQKIFTASGGIPRLINNICDTCLLMGASKALTTLPLSVVAQAVAQVEGSLAETGAQICPASETSDESGVCIVIEEPVQAADDIKPDSLMTGLVEIDDVQAKNNQDIVSKSVKRPRRIAMAIAAMLLLIAAGAVISQLLLKPSQLSAVFFPGSSPEKHQIIPNPTPPEGMDSKAIAHAPASNPLEDPGQKNSPSPQDMESKTPVGSSSLPQAQQEALTTQIPTPLSVEMPVAEGQLPPKTEFLSPENTEFIFFPYSLKSSSYQQQNRALQELAEIRQMGLTPYLVKVDLGDLGIWWRIYIGYYSTDEEAKKIKSLYKLTHMTIQKTDYACHLGEFSAETELMAMFERLRQSDFFPYVIQKGKDRFQLYVGAYERKSEAEFEHKNLIKKGFKNQIVKR